MKLNLCHAAACVFDKTPTPTIVLFEIFILFASFALLVIAQKQKKRILRHFAVMLIGVLVFEFFTSPMWHNFHMGWWAYLYRDVSWILSLGWTSMILAVVVLVDKFFRQYKFYLRFFLYVGLLTFLVGIFETIIVAIGIRGYSPEVEATLIGRNIFTVPIEALYYVPVFTGLIIGFYKYWIFQLENKLLVPIKNPALFRNLAISFIAVFLFELMVEPMALNQKLPQALYLYRDIHLLMTGLWVLIVWFSISIVDRLLIDQSQVLKFLGYIGLGGLIALPIESWFLIHQYRVYGQSSVDNFSGFTTPITGVPIEVAFAIPFYLALVIAFTKYWEISLDNLHIKTKNK